VKPGRASVGQALQAALFVSAVLPLPLTAAPATHGGGNSAAHWEYAGAEGPANWGRLQADYVLCGSGKRQSPVDLRNERYTDMLYPLNFQYQAIPLRILNNGHTVQANYNTVAGQQTATIGGNNYPLPLVPVYDSTLMLGDVAYQLLQFHFHTPSEHARDGRRYAMEVHLVHKDKSGNLAVVGIFMQRGAMNPTVQKVLDNASSTINEVVSVRNIKIDAAEILPENRQAFHYTGSLTTPPCSENVNWYVLKDAVEVSDSQVKKLAALIGQNARPLQAVNWRTIVTTE